MKDVEHLKNIYRRWVDAWNGETSAIDEIISNDFIFHREHGQAEIRGREELRALIAGSRAIFSELSFEIQIGPLVDGEWVVARNQAEGIYKGGMPGATAKAGTKMLLNGIDMLRIKDSEIIECWHNSNDLTFMLELGVVIMNTA